MITDMTFGKCLKYLLSVLDISINRLSRAINVDSSLVNRWVNEKRIPVYNTTYIENISEYLSKNIHNTFQEQHINELFVGVYKDDNFDGNVEEKIKKLLLEAQGYSIECKRMERKEKKNNLVNIEIHSECLNNNRISVDPKKKISAKDSIQSTKHSTYSVALSSEDKIIYQVDNVLHASTVLLEAAAMEKCSDNSTIYATYNHDSYVGGRINNYLLQWRDSLLEAMNNGWNVTFIIRLNRNINRTIKFINFIFPLIKTGRLNLYYLDKHDSSITGKETVVVPGIGVLSCFSTNQHSICDCAFLLKNEAAIKVFKDYYKVLLKTYGRSLVNYYPQENHIEYSLMLAETEDNIGNRFLLKKSFTVLTMPINLYKKLLEKKNVSSDEMLVNFELYKRRLKAFLSNVQNYEYKDIYSSDSIKNLIKHRQIYFYSYSGIEKMNLEVQDVVEYLQNIINLLETYENYNIAFISNNKDEYIEGDNFCCVIKDRQAVLLEVFEPSENNTKVRLCIDEPMLVNAFNEYFKERWEYIAPINKDKKEIIAWLQGQLNLLKR